MHTHFNCHFYYSVSGSPMEPNSTESLQSTNVQILESTNLCKVRVLWATLPLYPWSNQQFLHAWIFHTWKHTMKAEELLLVQDTTYSSRSRLCLLVLLSNTSHSHLADMSRRVCNNLSAEPELDGHARTHFSGQVFCGRLYVVPARIWQQGT